MPYEWLKVIGLAADVPDGGGPIATLDLTVSPATLTFREDIEIESGIGKDLFFGQMESARDGFGSIRKFQATYDFAVHGGAVSAIPVGETLPNGTIIVGGFMNVITAITGGATVAVHANAANDIQTAAADSGAPWSTTGKKAIVPKINTPETTSITLTADRRVTFTITTAAVTAGKVIVTLFIIPPQV